MSEFQLDARGLLCPLPVIRTQDKVEHMQAGDVLLICCSDPGVVHDIPAWSRINGHQVMAIDESNEEINISIRVGT